MATYNDDIELDVRFDTGIGRFRIKDTYGEFVPISIPMWKHCIENPFKEMNKINGTPIQRVIEIFMAEYHYLYIGAN